MAQQTKSLLAKYGKALKAAHEAHKDDETEFSNFGDLPPGIENGIAQLVECKFGEYEKGDMEGESFFYAAGAVLVPKEHAGIPIDGLRTSIMEPLCETPTRSRVTVKDHLAHIYNELRKLGVHTSTLKLEDLEATVDALKEAQPTFRFRTWVGKPSAEYPNPRTNHSWAGVCDYTPEEDGDGGVDDGTPTPEEKPKSPTKPKPGAAAKTPAKAAATTTTKKGPAKKAAPEPDETFDDGAEDLNLLAEQADADDDGAKAKLEALAIDKGVATEEQVENAPSWADVVSWINGESSPEEPAEEEPDWVPEKDGLYGFRPIDPKSKKPGKKVEVMVTAIDEKKKTVTLKNMVDGKTKYVTTWDKLEEAD